MILDLEAARKKWLAANPSGFLETQKAAKFDHDRKQTIGASEIGRCSRATAYEKCGTEADPDYVDDPGFAIRGNILENTYTAPLMRDAISDIGGKVLWSGQQDQQTFVVENWFLSTTPDGLSVGVKNNALKKYGTANCGGLFLNEYKSADPRKNLSTAQQEHADQVNYGMGVVTIDGEYKPKHALLLYADCSSLQLKPFVFAFDEAKFKAQRARAKNIMKAAETKKPESMLPEGKLKGGKQCKYCKFKQRCQGKSK